MKHEFKNLKIWQNARQLNLDIYNLSIGFPKEENYGLISQMRRASISIASNISEGSGYRSNKMFLKFLDITLGSLCELESQLYLAFDLNYLDTNDLKEFVSFIDQLKRMIISFMNKLKTKE